MTPMSRSSTNRQSRSQIARIGSSLLVSGCMAAGSVVAVALSASGDEFAMSGVSTAEQLKPLADLAAFQYGNARIVSAAPASLPPAIDFHLRPSVPMENRGESLAASEAFAHSKAVMPLLVGDLDGAPTSSLYRPTTARSVGAAPSLPHSTRPVVVRRGR